MRTSALFAAKKIWIFKIYGVSARTWGWDSADKGERINFSQFCTDVLYGRLLAVHF